MPIKTVTFDLDNSKTVDSMESDSEESDSEDIDSNSEEEESEELDTTDDLLRAEVLYDFVARNENELNLKKGDIIVVHDKDMSGWWKGELIEKTGKRKKVKEKDLSKTIGLVPSNYVKVIYKPPAFGFKLSSKVNLTILELQKKCGFVKDQDTKRERRKSQRRTKAKSKTEEKKDQMKTVEHVRNKEAKESILEVQQQLIKQKGFLVKQLALLQNEKLESTDIESVAKDAEERKEDKERTLGTAILRHPTLHRPKYVGRRRPTKFARTIQKEKADELLEEKEAEIETEESKTEINAEYINVVSEESPTNEADEALSSNKENQVAIQKHEGEDSEYYRKEDTLSAEGGVRLSWWGEEVGFLTKELDAMIRDMATSVDSLIQVLLHFFLPCLGILALLYFPSLIYLCICDRKPRMRK